MAPCTFDRSQFLALKLPLPPGPLVGAVHAKQACSRAEAISLLMPVEIWPEISAITTSGTLPTGELDRLHAVCGRRCRIIFPGLTYLATCWSATRLATSQACRRCVRSEHYLRDGERASCQAVNRSHHNESTACEAFRSGFMRQQARSHRGEKPRQISAQRIRIGTNRRSWLLIRNEARFPE